jgi:hypothetical protein
MSDEPNPAIPDVFEDGALVTFIYLDDSYENEQRVTGELVDCDGTFLTITDDEQPARRLQVDLSSGRVETITESRTKEIGDVETVRFNAPPGASRSEAITNVMNARKSDQMLEDGVFTWYNPAELSN